MKGVILAAGLGSRFGPHTQEEHKLLLTVGNVPIIDYTLQAFCRAGISDVALVTGFMSDRINDWVGSGSRYGLKITYIFNPDYRSGNAVSVQAARTFTKDQSFILSMGDHLISSDLIANVIDAHGNFEDNVLGVDFDLRKAHEATLVLVGTETRISSIGKHIRKWNGIDSGVFRFNSDIHGLIDQWIACDKSGRFELSGALDYLIKQGGLLKSCDISDCYWHDVDNMEDLHHVRTAGLQLDE
jgi:glucose-1-phosphate thymidylyltransferase